MNVHRITMDRVNNRGHQCHGAQQRDHQNESWNKVPLNSSSSGNESRRHRRHRHGLVNSRRSIRCSSARSTLVDDPHEIRPCPGVRKDGLRSAEAPARMRGGGSTDLLNSFLKTDADFMWRNSKFVVPTRLEGGGCCGSSKDNQKSSGKSPCAVVNKCQPAAKETKCALNNYLDNGNKQKDFGACMKNPCIGTQCLLKAFNETQDFVNSLGQVPGLAGLGIIESPYFGKSPESNENKKIVNKPDACNPSEAENFKKANTSSSGHTCGSKKAGVVQEAASTFADPFQGYKLKKKEDKVEKQKEIESNGQAIQMNEESPCGEPKCKSRPKKNTEVEGTEDKMNNAGDKLSPKTDQKNSKAKPSPGAGGDLAKNAKPNHAKGNQFVYSFGNSYPTSVYGHKNCNFLRRRVPASQGWMWTEADTIANRKVRVGWKPGAISTTLRDMMNLAKEGFLNESNRPKSAPSRSKKNQKMMPFAAIKKQPTCNEEQTEEETHYPPTLHIHRRDGDYYITMYPIRQETSDVPRVEEPLNPLQFKIVKSKDSLASSSTASDMEIEFSPPAAVNRVQKKPNVVHIETNVTQAEILDEIRKMKQAGSEDANAAKKDKAKKKPRKVSCL